MNLFAMTSLLKKASSEIPEKGVRHKKYLASSGTDKVKTARRIAEEDGIKEGLIWVQACVEPCVSFDIHRNRENKLLELVTRYRKCLMCIITLSLPGLPCRGNFFESRCTALSRQEDSTARRLGPDIGLILTQHFYSCLNITDRASR
jgi:hypothetical protein